VIGKIHFYNHTKGYGFITPLDSPSQQYFFHWSNFWNRETPAIGAFVVFGLAPGISQGKKVQAVGIRFATSEEVVSAALEVAHVNHAGVNALAAQSGVGS
jgi:cold shock CspA family protein